MNQNQQQQGQNPANPAPAPAQPNVRTRSVFRTQQLPATTRTTRDRRVRDRGPLYAGITRVRANRSAPANPYGVSILQADPRDVPRPDLPAPIPRVPYIPLTWHNPGIRPPSPDFQPSLLHRLIRHPTAGHNFFEILRPSMHVYNELRGLNRGLARLLHPITQVQNGAGPGPINLAFHLNLQCQNRRLNPSALANATALTDDLFSVVDQMFNGAAQDYLDATTQCQNTLRTRPDLKFHHCNGDHRPFDYHSRRINQADNFKDHDNRVVCEECVRNDFHETSPMRFGLSRIICLCARHSEERRRSGVQYPWEECSCPNDFSPFRYRMSPTWFCSLCALAHLDHEQDRWYRECAARFQQAIRPSPQRYIRDYVHDRALLGNATRNRCLICDVQGLPTTWHRILRSYPLVHIRGQEAPVRDFRGMYRLCMGCFKHVPDRDIDRDANCWRGVQDTALPISTLPPAR